VTSPGVRSLGEGFARICWGNSTACDGASSSDSPSTLPNSSSFCQDRREIPLPSSQDLIIGNMPTNSLRVPDAHVDTDVALIDFNHPMYDGCYFDKNAYPKGSGYLAIWDMFDCKIAKYIGFGPDVTLPSIIVLIMMGLFFGPLGILFCIISLSFAIFTILIAIRVVTIFLVSMFAIVFFIYFSPLIIPLLLFEKTKEIFNGWLSSFISFLVQPVILFMYVAILLNVTEPILLGSAHFEGDVKGGRVLKCDGHAQYDSLLCLFGNHSNSPLGEVLEYSGLRGIGITLKILGEPIVEAVEDSAECDEGLSGECIETALSGIPTGAKRSFAQILTIFKGLLIIFLFYKILDHIPKLSAMISEAVGYQGQRGALKGAKPKFGRSMGTLFIGARAVQKAGMGLVTGKNLRGTAKRAGKAAVGTVGLVAGVPMTVKHALDKLGGAKRQSSQADSKKPLKKKEEQE
ncbi:type IV secretion system protein, partial [Pseudomonadota bacterium]